MKLYSIIFFVLVGVLGRNSYGMRLDFIPKNPLYTSVDVCVHVELYHSENITKNFPIRISSSFSDIANVTPTTIGPKPLSKVVEICGVNGGYTQIKAECFDNITLPAYLPVFVSREFVLKVLSDVSGWIYFISWSVSYYPQIYTNYSRKSVVGLNFDFATLNIIGFALYSLYNCAMYFSSTIKHEYFHNHPKGMNPVIVNDVIFSLHALLSTSVIIYQCCVYERGTQKVSYIARIIMTLYAIIVVGSAVLAYISILTWLEFILYCSYIKLTVTMIKYIPQAIMNYTRQSTVGWSIENVVLDFIGGIFSMLQMIINDYNYNDSGSIFGNLTKFGLGLFSVQFDVFFMYQHYVLYRTPYEEQIDEIPAPETETETETETPVPPAPAVDV